MSRWTSLRRQSPSVLQGSGLCPLLFVFPAPWILKEWRRRGYNTHHSALRHSVSLLGEGLKNSFVLIFFFLSFYEQRSPLAGTAAWWVGLPGIPPAVIQTATLAPAASHFPQNFSWIVVKEEKKKRKTQRIGDFVSKNLNFHPSVHQEAFRVKV